MLVPKGDGTYFSGPLDVILIYRHMDEGTFHPVVYQWHPMPGLIPEVGDVDFVRLNSKMHHTAGFASLEEAQENVRNELQPMLNMADENVMLDPPYPWFGETGDVIMVTNWLRRDAKQSFRDVFV
jgi:hypothetical protein